MATESSIAESQPGGVVVAPNLDWSTQKVFSHSTYRLVPQFPNTYGATIALGNGQTPSTINLPLDVFNLSESYLSYNIVIPAGAAGIIPWWPADIAGLGITHIQHYGNASNNYIVDVDNLSNYMKIIDKKESSWSDYISRDGTSEANAIPTVPPSYAVNGLQPSNVLVTNAPAIRDIGGVESPSFLNYIEPAYFAAGLTAAATTLNVMFPLRLIKNTLFSCNKRATSAIIKPPIRLSMARQTNLFSFKIINSSG